MRIYCVKSKLLFESIQQQRKWRRSRTMTSLEPLLAVL